MANIRQTKKITPVKSTSDSQINWPVVGPIVGILFLLLLWIFF